jgi:hypothetical protein
MNGRICNEALKSATREIVALVCVRAPDREAKQVFDRRLGEAQRAGDLAAFDYAASVAQAGIKYGYWPWGQS